MVNRSFRDYLFRTEIAQKTLLQQPVYSPGFVRFYPNFQAYRTVPYRNRLSIVLKNTAKSMKNAGIFQNDRRSVAVGYGALVNFLTTVKPH